VTIADVYRSLWRRKLTVVVLTAILAGAAWYLVSRQPSEYRATAVVRVQQEIADPTAAYGALQTGAVLARTYADIATTLTTARYVERALGGAVPLDRIAGSLTARQLDDVDLLSVSATARDPRTAAAIAAAVPTALEQFVRDAGTVGERITPVELPSVPRKRVSPRPWLAAAVAAVIGLVFNGGLVVALEALADRTVRGSELERVAGLAVLATIPNVSLRPIGQLPARSELDRLERLERRSARA
jgi:capsular polysaccharide biosynthesis protein